MKAQILQKDLISGLAIVTRAASTRSTLPILEHIKLECSEDNLLLAATDLEIGIETKVKAKIEEAGGITVPAKILSDLVKTFSAEWIDVATNDKTKTLKLKCGASRANVKGLDSFEFPLITPPKGETQSIEFQPFRTAISQVAFAAARDQSRPTLAGVLMQSGEMSTLVAADGFRLAVKQFDVGWENPTDVIIPARALWELARIDTEQELVSITLGDNRVAFDLGHSLLVSQLIPGNFPDWRQIIPKEHTTRTVIQTAELLTALSSTVVFARDAAFIGRFEITPTDNGLGTLSISAVSAETGDTLTQMDVMVEGEPIEIAFNMQYFSDVVKAISSAQIVLETQTPSSPGVIKAIDDPHYTHVIMPMHLGR